jgi:tRNA A-37 threonylcarbamoyl transferase component Bud32
VNASTTVKAGDTLEGRYKILNLVGEGGMGKVFLAEHMLIKRRVAIKILRPELAQDANVVERFMNEARAAGSIGHPHIVESTDMGFTRDEVPFIVFEYLEGTLLTDEIYRTKGMSPRRALRIAGQIASALHAAHQAGIVHRDLKSDNIFLTDKEDASDHVKVLDFGISRFLEQESAQSDSSNRHGIMGTPEFMAPEQITSPESVDKRVDIYALGVVLYEMLTARRPFDFDGPMVGDTRTFDETDKLLHKILTETATPMSRPDLPPGLENLIHERLLAKNPEDRFQSMKDVQAALEAFFGVARRDSVPIEPIATALPPAAEAVSLPQPAKKKTGLIIGIVGVALAGLGGGAFMLTQKQTPAAATGPTGPQQPAADPKKAFQDAVDRLCEKVDSLAQASKMRVQGIASLPMLRAAIETDAATLADMVKDKDVIFQAQPGETLEIFQQRNGKTTPMLRIPAAASPLQAPAMDTAHLESDGTTLLLLTSTPVSNQNGKNEGMAVLAVPVDLSSIQQALATKGDAAIVGLAKPIVLAGSAPTGGTQLACKTGPQTNLSITVSAKPK